MRRRFGRRRRGADDGARPIDAAILEKLTEAGLVPGAPLETVEADGVPDSFARLGRGTTETGSAVLVAFSPRSGSDAVLALLAAGGGEGAASPFAVAPHWSEGDLRRVSRLQEGGLALAAISSAGLDGGRLAVEPGPRGFPAPAAGYEQRASGVERSTLSRAVQGLEGLAAKHGGVLRGYGDGLELVVLARRIAVLRAAEGGPELELLVPNRSQLRLAGDGLAEALDRLEGGIRKRLNDRRIREGEEGLRGTQGARLAEAVAPATSQAWPLGGRDADVIDWAGRDDSGAPWIGAVRERLGLAELSLVLRASDQLEPHLGWLLPPMGTGAGLPLGLALAARELSPAIEVALARLQLPAQVFDLVGAGASPALRARQAVAASAPSLRTPAPRAEPEPRAEAEPETTGGASERSEGPDREEGSEGPRGGRSRRRRRGRRGGQREGSDSEASASSSEDERKTDEGKGEGASEGRPAEAPGFLELSAFDLDEDLRSGDADGEGNGRRRRRGRRRRGGRREGSGEEEGEADPAPDAQPAAADAAAADAAEAAEAAEASLDDEDDTVDADENGRIRLADAPDLEEAPEANYEQADLEEEPLTQTEKLRLEREQRRRSREAPEALSVAGFERAATPEELAQEPALPRGRAAILAHADRDSVACAVLLAREIRSVEGIWVYPQSELMTFFRSVATDLRNNTPIYVVGFEPKPAHDAIQAASLYQDRIVWFDDKAWAPEDLHALREAIGESCVHVTPGLRTSLPQVLGVCERRSRFSDKLVDLITGRFTQHDYERWGRLWWYRLGEVATRTGDRRADLDALVNGRPSDLAREAERAATPDHPPEVALALQHDYRLVHFGGHTLVVAEVAEGLDLALLSRLLRERYGSAISLTWDQGSEVLVLGADDVSGRRAIDVGGMADHLGLKFSWVETLSDADHVARVRVQGLSPARLDEVISEIALGRAILEG